MRCATVHKCSLRFLFVALLLQCSLLLQASKTARKAPRLEEYPVNTERVSVSGISSGGFFAVQFHVAFSKSIMGVGVLAGGPFWCAKDDLDVAMSACMSEPDLIDVDELVDITYATAATGTIDIPTHMNNDKAYLFSGTLDSVVDPGVMKNLAQYYGRFLTGPDSNIAVEFDVPAEHAMVTDDFGNKCNILGLPYINNCNYSSAYHILTQIYGNMQPATTSTGKLENLLEFDQSEFFLDLPKDVSMDDTGFIYVPTNCQGPSNGTLCKLHIAFHGCKQGRKYLSNEFALHAGYNGLAEANDIIIMYPQVENSTLPFNPKGCWDWWGYTSEDYACKLGPQMAGVKLMFDRVAGV